MPLYKTPEERASETVTIRLTQRDKALLDYLAELEGRTLTDLIRGLVAKRAEALQVREIPEAPKKRRPGRPKKKKPSVDTERAPAAPTVASTPPPAIKETTPPPRETQSPDQTAHQKALMASHPVHHILSRTAEVRGRAITFFDLLVRFHKSFAHRAEGTKKELEDTIEFLCLGGDAAIIPPETPLAILTSERLQEIRRIIQSTDLRFAKKNLHLTYLRMMLHFGVKDRDIDLHVNPTGELEPLSITESNEGWRFFGGK